MLNLAVWEWCEGNWHDNYENAPTDGSAWITKNNNTADFDEPLEDFKEYM